MNRWSFDKRRKDKGSVVASVAIHAVLIALIASITFRYPIAALFDTNSTVPEEHLQYITVRPAPQPRGNGQQSLKSDEKKKQVKEAAPAPLVAPTAVPTQLPPAPAAAAPSSGSANGAAGGTGGSPNGTVANVSPAMPDARIELRPSALRMPLSIAQKNDSAVKAIFMAYREAEIEAEAHAGRSPRDWTFEKGGGKYGIDSSYIYLGKFKLPSAILAALPLNPGGVDGARLIANRRADWIRQDIYDHAQGLSEDDFRAAVKRIRERKEREHEEDEAAKKAEQKPATPVP